MNMLPDADRDWLKALHLELWPEPDRRTQGEKLRDRIFPEARTAPVSKEPKEQLTKEELERVLNLVRGHKLVTNLFPYGPICGVGLNVFEHPGFPGLPPEKLLSIIDKNLPSPSRLERAAGDVKPKKKRIPGTVPDEAYELFISLAGTEENLRWLREYKLELPREQVYYDY